MSYGLVNRVCMFNDNEASKVCGAGTENGQGETQNVALIMVY